MPWVKDATPVPNWNTPSAGTTTWSEDNPAGDPIGGYFNTYDNLTIDANNYFHTNDEIFTVNIKWSKE
jgi:hypothetical protein